MAVRYAEKKGFPESSPMSDTDDVEFHLLVSSFDNNARALVYPGLSNGLTPANKRKIEVR